MNSLSRAALFASHLAVLGLGAVAGIQTWPEDRVAREPTQPPAHRTERVRTGGSFDFQDPSVIAAAWESLKDRQLPVSERLGIQQALLREWSVVDFQAAVLAVLAESPRYQEYLLESCRPGILADPARAWELVAARAFGWETARVRKLWIDELLGQRPVDVLPALHEMPHAEKVGALGTLARCWVISEDAAVRSAVWEGLLSHASTADDDLFGCVAEALGRSSSSESILLELLRGATPAERRLAAAAFGISLNQVGREEFNAELSKVPDHLRGEVVSATLATEERGVEGLFRFAQMAAEAGDYDALAAAAKREGFRDVSRNVLTQAELLDWALTLPEDPRVIGLYRQAVEAASEHDFEEIGARVLALPPGLKRDHGLAAILKSFEPIEEEVAQLDELLDSIADPAIRAAAREERRLPEAE